MLLPRRPRWSELDERVEVLHVRGGDDETLSVRRHGPLLEGVLGGERTPLALVGRARERLRRGSRGWPSRAQRRRAARRARRWASGGRHGLRGCRRGGRHAGGGLDPRRALSTGSCRSRDARWYIQQGPVEFAQLPRERLAGGRGWALAADNAFPRSRAGARWSGCGAPRPRAAHRRAAAHGDRERAARAAPGRRAAGRRRRATRAQPGCDALALAERRTAAAEANELIGLLREWDGRSTPDSVRAAAYHVFLVSDERAVQPPLGEALTRRYLALPLTILAGGVRNRTQRPEATPAAAGPIPWWWARRCARAARSLAAPVVQARLEPQVELGRPARAALPAVRSARRAAPSSRRSARSQPAAATARSTPRSTPRAATSACAWPRLPFRDRHRRARPGVGVARAR